MVLSQRSVAIRAQVVEHDGYGHRVDGSDRISLQRSFVCRTCRAMWSDEVVTHIAPQKP